MAPKPVSVIIFDGNGDWASVRTGEVFSGFKPGSQAPGKEELMELVVGDLEILLKRANLTVKSNKTDMVEVLMDKNKWLSVCSGSSSSSTNKQLWLRSFYYDHAMRCVALYDESQQNV